MNNFNIETLSNDRLSALVPIWKNYPQIKAEISQIGGNFLPM
jgi:hypothetical protein